MRPNALYHLGFFIFLILTSCAGVQSRYHRVAQGESLDLIATRYKVPVLALKKYNTDVINQGLKAGAKLYVPFEESPFWNIEEQKGTEKDRSSQPTRLTASNTEVPIATFSWPVRGSLSSYFGPRHRKMHEGIDIAARKGTAVRAARSGHVIYASNQIRGYGKMVIVRHADTYSTVYAHLSKINARKGQFVARGELLGLVGRTGHATGNHLHFEVRNYRVPVDPLLYLHGQYAANKIGSRK